MGLSSIIYRYFTSLNFYQAWCHLNAAVENVIKGARYQRVDQSGPRVKKCGRTEPIVCQYFTGPKVEVSLKEEEKMMFTEDGAKFMAHNGKKRQ